MLLLEIVSGDEGCLWPEHFKEPYNLVDIKSKLVFVICLFVSCPCLSFGVEKVHISSCCEQGAQLCVLYGTSILVMIEIITMATSHIQTLDTKDPCYTEIPISFAPLPEHCHSSFLSNFSIYFCFVFQWKCFMSCIIQFLFISYCFSIKHMCSFLSLLPIFTLLIIY